MTKRSPTLALYRSRCDGSFEVFAGIEELALRCTEPGHRRIEVVVQIKRAPSERAGGETGRLMVLDLSSGGKRNAEPLLTVARHLVR